MRPDHMDLPAPSERLQVSVAVPACNEESLIEQTLMAFVDQQSEDGRQLSFDTFEILLLVNNSSDRTAELARAFAARHPALKLHVLELSFVPPHDHVGSARRAAMDLASTRVSDTNIVATTDADTAASQYWIGNIISTMREDVDVVAGYIGYGEANYQCREHVLSLSYRTLLCRLENFYDPRPHDPAPRHFQNYGPNLAVRSGVYKRAGGVPAVSSLEDIGLIDALKAVDAKIRHTFDVRVSTSARIDGRVGFGHSVQLGRWLAVNQKASCQLVQPPDYHILQYSVRALCLRVWRQRKTGELTRLASLAGVSLASVEMLLLQSAYAGSFAAAVLKASAEAPGTLANFQAVGIRKAIVKAVRTLAALDVTDAHAFHYKALADL